MTDLSLEALKPAARALKVRRARTSLLDYAQLMMPSPEDPGDSDLSRFTVLPHIRLMAELLEKVERGELLRFCVSIPPQHGKTEICTRLFPAWFMSKNPYRSMMVGTYNQDWANTIGSQIREYVQSPAHRQVFPHFALRKDKRAADEMFTKEGGAIRMLGRGGSATGRPADLFIIDDPLKDAVEAESPTTRREVWEWFTKVVMTRIRVGSAVGIIHTRWNEDDLIGRLVDPTHPDHDKDIAAEWTYINIPAIQNDEKIAAALGLKIGDALWADEFPVSHLESIRRINPRGFSALYQGSPAPDDGIYFKRDDLVGYRPEELPKALNIYAASDHALTEKQENDASVLGAFGVDRDDNIWILPDLAWLRVETDVLVEEIIAKMRLHKPQLWWAEDEHIKKGIGPFLRKRQNEEKIYTPVVGIRPSTDLRLRARSIQGRMAMRKVRFPKFAPWWAQAENEMLKFSAATHDDFVAFLALVGLGLDSQVSAAKPEFQPGKVIRVGSIEWVKAADAQRRRQEERRKAAGGF